MSSLLVALCTMTVLSSAAKNVDTASVGLATINGVSTKAEFVMKKTEGGLRSRLTVRLGGEDRAALARLAQRMGVSVGAAARGAMRRGVTELESELRLKEMLAQPLPAIVSSADVDKALAQLDGDLADFDISRIDIFRDS